MELSGKSYHLQIRTNWIINQLVLKLVAAFQRVLDIFLLLPTRLYRLVKHLYRGVRSLVQPTPFWWQAEPGSGFLINFCWWLVGLLIYILECFGIGEIYEMLSDFFKYNTRPLHHWEIKVAQTIYGDTINYKRVRVDELALAGPKQHRFCYVSFYLINSWGPMPNSTFLHELMHVWQYQKMGARYMVQALRGQYSSMGYNYGGVSALREYLEQGKGLRDFNLEQQADIVTDYYLITKGYAPQWGRATQVDLPVYEKFIEKLDKN